jgi:hypothetical protein
MWLPTASASVINYMVEEKSFTDRKTGDVESWTSRSLQLICDNSILVCSVPDELAEKCDKLRPSMKVQCSFSSVNLDKGIIRCRLNTIEQA